MTRRILIAGLFIFDYLILLCIAYQVAMMVRS